MAPYGNPGAPVVHLKTNRGLLKLILLGMITFGIYPIVVMAGLSTDLNILASKYDGKKTGSYLVMIFVWSWLTFGIDPFIWYHGLSARMGNELKRRGIAYDFGAGSFWGWNVLGALIFVGPLVYTHKLLKAMNLLCENYNLYG